MILHSYSSLSPFISMQSSIFMKTLTFLHVNVMQELRHQVSLIRSVANKVFSEMGTTLSYKVGTMIEIPRAALVADEVG